MAAIFLLIASVVLRRSGVPSLLSPSEIGEWLVCAVTLAGTVGVALVGVVAGWLPWNRPSRGHAAWSRSVRRTRWIASIGCVWLAACVMVLGWFDLVRSAMGDWILLDEAAAVAPAMMAMFIGWWAHEPFARRHSSARSRVGFVVSQSRVLLPLLLVPVAAVLVTQELVERVFRPMSTASETAGLAAALVALLLAPALVMVVLPTAPLPSWNGLDQRIRSLFTDLRIGVRGVRLWRTDGTLMNGIALGIVPFCRWVLLSDALVDELTPDETLAVAGHEAGHLRHRHAAWLAGACIGSVGCVGLGLEALIDWMSPVLPSGPLVAWSAMGLMALIVTLFFGTVSRACERQADAFAVSALSPGDHVASDAVDAMRRALAMVAFANGIPVRRPSFRHGSIEGRRHALAALATVPKASIPIDRRVRVLKAIIVASIFISLAGALIEPPRTDPLPSPALDASPAERHIIPGTEPHA